MVPAEQNGDQGIDKQHFSFYCPVNYEQNIGDQNERVCQPEKKQNPDILRTNVDGQVRYEKKDDQYKVNEQ